MSNIVYIASSIDGFIATKDGGLNWLEELSNPSKSDFGYEKFISKIDALIMGRNTFEKVISFDPWPYTKKVFVLSNQLKELPETMKDKAEIISGNLKEIAPSLKKRGFNNLYIDGGKTIQNFLKEDLIDELIISTIPILLGDGIPLFGKQDHSIKFEHVSTKAFDGGLVKSHYKKII